MTDAPEQPVGHTAGPWFAALPRYQIGERVHYLDHQTRQQTGEVARVEASWASYMKGRPLIIYTVSHPTYRNNRMYIGEDGILASAITKATS